MNYCCTKLPLCCHCVTARYLTPWMFSTKQYGLSLRLSLGQARGGLARPEG